MTKRKGLLDVEVDVRGLLEELPVSNSAASKARTEQPAILSDSILISNRINTLVQIEERHIDLNNNVLNLEGSIMKNHQQIKLPSII